MENECIICGGKGDGPISVASEDSIKSIKSFGEKWFKIGQKMEKWEQIKLLTFTTEVKMIYHRSCYQDLCHSGHLLRAQDKFEKDLTSSHKKTSMKATTSKKRKLYDQDMCVFCQEDKTSPVHNVSSEEMGRKFLEIKASSKNNEICARLAFLFDEKDAFAQNMKYHTSCLRNETRLFDVPDSRKGTTSDQETLGKVISDIEIANIVRCVLTSNFPSLDMNSIQNTYKGLLEENEVSFNLETNYKPHIKDILVDRIPEIEFSRRGPKPEIVFTKVTKEKLMTEWYESCGAEDEMETLYKASKIIRNEIESMKDWHFTGTFKDFDTPVRLYQLMKWVIGGLHTDLSIMREREIETSSRNLAQGIISSFRSRRQLTYKTKTDMKFKMAKRTPLTVGLALTSYQGNRSRSDVETLNNINLGITYDEVERTTTRMATAIIEDIKLHSNRVHMPPFIKYGIRPLFAIDNIDLGSDAGSFHGADLMIAQKEEDGVSVLGNDLKLDLSIKDKTLKQSLEVTYYDCDKPVNPVVSHTVIYKLDTLKGISAEYENFNVLWLLMSSYVVSELVNSGDGCGEVLEEFVDTGDGFSQDVVLDVDSLLSTAIPATNDEVPNSSDKSDSKSISPQAKPPETMKTTNKKLPTWSAFNSAIGDETPKWNVGIAAPLYRRSPTEWPVLLTILKQAQEINCVTVGEGCRPIITLDGDLYDRAVKLKDYKKTWCIRLGGLHITIAALKCLGKYVEGSGLDLAWEASGVYGPATIRQILEGRHIYRGIEAHTITLIAIFHLYLQVAFPDEQKVEIGKQISQALGEYASYEGGLKDCNPKSFRSHVATIEQTLSAEGMFELLGKWKHDGKGIQKFLTNYMAQIEVLLMFTAATRTSNWKLHLAKFEELLPYFHAHDQYNYGRWGPLYIADMLEMQTTDPETWKFLNDGNFVIAKHTIPFTAIDPDHAIEQEHKKMKIKAGFIGITGNEPALEKYFIIAPTLCRLVKEFQEYSGIDTRKSSSLHHEFIGDKSTKMTINAAKIVQILSKEGNPFLKNDMFNLMTFAVTPKSVSSDIEERDQLGRKALEKFVSTRMVDKTVKFWDSQTKNKFSFFKDISLTVKAKVNDKLMSIKQERKLLSRLLVVAKSRPDFMVKDAIGDFEFHAAPPSNFHSDGSMVMLSGKSQVVTAILNIPLPESEDTNTPASEGDAPSVLIIDAMCIVNMVPKTPNMTNAVHFAEKFVSMVAELSFSYDEIRVVFDQYLPGSLKETTRDKRTIKTQGIHYHVNDNTEIKNIKNFLSHICTKAELTKYLSDKLIAHYQGKHQKVVVMHHTTMEANCPLADILSMSEMMEGKHNLEEGDQLVILNAFDVMHKNPQTTLHIFSVDTDVFVLLTGFFAMLPNSTTLLRSKGERIPIGDSYARLGSKRAEALIGWYAFKGTDNTGSFAGKGVLSHTKAFLQADDDILDAFAKFGLTQELPNWIYDQMERYICLLYKTGDISVSSVRELRWTLFAQQGKEGQQLPPTLGTLIPHTCRAHYMTLVWKSSNKPCTQFPSPTKYYWELKDDQLRPVYCINAPAPEALLELHKCNCKTGCKTKSCGCRKNQLACTDMCGCGDICQNMVQDSPLGIAEIE